MERLCISSFLQHGHPVHLFVYQDTEGIPDGTVVHDANQIIPDSRIFKYKNYNTYAGFANFFRYKLLLEKGGWWVDADTVCLQAFDFPAPYVLSSEAVWSPEGLPTSRKVNNGVLKAPAGCRLFEEAWAFCDRANPAELAWGESGPELVGRLVAECNFSHFVQPPERFCPLHYPDWKQQLDPAASTDFGPQSSAVHLWNEMWRRSGFDKDARWDEACLYERLKRRYLGSSESLSKSRALAGNG